MSRIRHLARLGAFALTCALASTAFAGHTPPPPLRIDPLVEQFMSGNFIESASLSPDGQHVASVAQIEGSYFVFLTDTNTRVARLLSAPRSAVLQQRWASPLPVMFHPCQVAWIDNGRIAINFLARHKEHRGTGVVYGEVVGLDGKVLRKLGHGLLAIQRDDAGKPTGEVLVNSISPGSYVDRINVDSGETHSYEFNPPGMQRLERVALDSHGQMLGAQTADADFFSDNARFTIWYRRDLASPWQKVDERSVTDDPITPLRVASQPGHLVVLARNGADKKAVWDYDADKHAFGTRLAADDQDDIEVPRAHVDDTAVVGFPTGGMKSRTIWIDPEMARLQAMVDQHQPDQVNVLRRVGAGIVEVTSHSDTDPGTLSVLDVGSGNMREVLNFRPDIDPKRMQAMQVLHYASSDGMEVPAYLTLPGKTTQPPPLIVLVHGGPISRDGWGWNEDVQLFAAHGYAVLQPQFRGSTGFGLRFEQAGFQQWGRRMQDDVSAGVRDLAARKVIDPARVCIVGTSYGGYAALWGLESTPELYKCGVDTSGVSDMEQQVTSESAGSSWRATRAMWKLWLGDSDKDHDAWAGLSPRLHADRLRAPLLIVHGEEDRVVPISQGEKMRDAAESQHKDVQWLSFEAENHGVVRVNDRRIWFGAMLELFARTIGEGEPPVPATPKMIDAATTRAQANKQQLWLPGAHAQGTAPAASAPQ